MTPKKTTKRRKNLTRKDILRMIEKNGGPEGLDLSSSDLSGINLGDRAIKKELKKWQENLQEETPVWYSPKFEGINLQNVDLSRAILRGANLNSANLQEAILFEANLQGASLGGANLQSADFGGADLRDASLLFTNLQKTKLWNANLQKANLLWASLQEASLVGANLQEASLEEADLQDAELVQANLQKATLDLANLEKAILWKANLQGSSLLAANLQETILDGANLQYAILEDTNLQKASLEGADLINADFSRISNGKGIHWHGSILENIKLPPPEILFPVGEENDGQYGKAQNIYLLFKDHFNDTGHYDYARECYIKEREMERRAHRQYKRWWPWLWLTLFRWSSTYGQNPVAVFLWTLGWVVLFAAIYAYFLAGGIRIAPEHWTEWWPVLYSMASFATLEFSGFEALSPWATLATSIESLLGIFWLAYFVYALANRTRSF